MSASTSGVVPRWEWRTFGDSFGDAEARFAALTCQSVGESDELYLLSQGSDASVKVRGGKLDVKRREAVNDDGLEQWRPVLKAEFPLSAADVRALVDALAVPGFALAGHEYTLD